MRGWRIAALIAVFFPLSSSSAGELRDDHMHFLAGAAIAAGDSASLTLLAPEMRESRRWAHAAGVCAAAAAGKEGLDKFQNRGQADPWDFAATLGGCGAGLMLGQGIAVIAGPKGGEVSFSFEF